jgi:retron-type reverse transcriptase
MINLYRAVRGKTLHQSWRKVKEKGSQSPSSETRDLIKAFDSNSFANLNRIDRQLRENRFEFLPQLGVAKKRHAKTPRPIVIAPVQNRIVQRAILDTIQAVPAVQEIIFVATSFGGLRERGVRKAIWKVQRAHEEGACYFIRSDIESFFTRIPRDRVCKDLSGFIDDSDFLLLFEKAIETNLANLKELGEAAYYFPLREQGVAQGSALSALVGNFLLRDFDRELNGRGVTCLRYIDDFILLGRTRSHVWKAFERAQAILFELGMRAYDPRSDTQKAEEGSVDKCCTFLGCRIYPGLVQPSPAAKQKLLEKVENIVQRGMRGMKEALARPQSKLPRFIQTLQELNLVIRGWGDAFSFTNDRELFQALDNELSERMRRLLNYSRILTGGRGETERRRVLGVHLLIDTKVDRQSHAI